MEAVTNAQFIARQLGGFTAHREWRETETLWRDCIRLLYSRAASTRLRHYNVLGAHVVVTARGDSRPDMETGGLRAEPRSHRTTRRRGQTCLEEQHCLLARIEVAKVLLLVRCVRAEV